MASPVTPLKGKMSELPPIDRMAILASLGPKKQGSRISFFCPNCQGEHKGTREGFNVEPSRGLSCNRRNNCGWQMDILAFANGGTMPDDQQYRQLMKRYGGLGVALGPTLASRPKPVPAEGWKHVWAHAIDSLPADWVAARGFTSDFLHTAGLRYLPATKEAKEAILAEKMPKGHLERVLIPVNDADGNQVGFVSRATKDDGYEKYLNSTGLKFGDIGGYNLDGLARSGATTAVLVEGLLDVQATRTAGMENVLSLCTSSAVAERLMVLNALGVSTLILCLDNDTAGNKGQAAIIESCAKEQLPFALLVTNKKRWQEIKDPGELLQKAPDLLTCIEADVKDGFGWLAEYYASQHGDLKDPRNLYPFIWRCVQFDDCEFNGIHEIAAENYFWPTVQKLTGCSLERILKIRDEIMIKRAKRKAEKQMRKIFQAGQ